MLKPPGADLQLPNNAERHLLPPVELPPGDEEGAAVMVLYLAFCPANLRRM